MKYRVDSTWRRMGRDGVLIAGSPSRLFRLTAAGAELADRIEAGEDVGSAADNRLLARLLDAGAIHPDPSRTSSGHRTASAFTAADVTIVTPQRNGTVSDDGRVTVDDGSVPSLIGAAIRLDPNRGPAAARNAGRRLVDTALIAFVDDDVELLDNEVEAYGGASYLDALLPHFDDPKVGLVAPRVLGDERSSLDLGDEPARIRAGSRVSYVPAAAIVVRASAFDDVGGFDETMRFGEDVDFVWRLDQAGWTCRYEPASSVWHRPRGTLQERLRQQIGYGSSAGPLALRHPHALTPVRSSGWSAAMWAFVAVGQPLPAVGVALGSTAALIAKLADVPPRSAIEFTARGHLAAGRQLASAMRRAWWPIVVVGCLVSKRVRILAAAAVLANPKATPTDIAHGLGIWRGMRAARSWRPLVPQIMVQRETRRARRAQSPARSDGRGQPPVVTAR